jgi:hypothetical protein
MRDVRKAQAGARLARLRRNAAELKEWGWTVDEPEEALTVVLSKTKIKEEAN